MRPFFASLLLVSLLAACAAKADDRCAPLTFEGSDFVVCKVLPARDKIRLELIHPDGMPFAQFDRVEAHYAEAQTPLILAMNAGMYHEDRRPVGLYIQNGEEIARLQPNPGPGNFGLLPNGVFWVDGSIAGVTESLTFADRFADASPAFATQSGPMLVIDGQLHPDFNEDGPSRKRRNGVGISADGETLYFAISDDPVNFHTFGRLFRDELKTPNALFLDGVVSKLYAAELGRSDRGLDMGPILTVSASAEKD